MLLKRFYKTSPEGVRSFDYVSVAHTGTHPEQNFSDRLVAGAVAEGWMSLSRGKIIVHAQPEDLVYTIKRGPGVYCCFTGKKLDGQVEARAHVAKNFAGKPSPDKSNPGGYEVLHAYECVLDADQHDKFMAKPGQLTYRFAKK